MVELDTVPRRVEEVRGVLDPSVQLRRHLQPLVALNYQVLDSGTPLGVGALASSRAREGQRDPSTRRPQACAVAGTLASLLNAGMTSSANSFMVFMPSS